MRHPILAPLLAAAALAATPAFAVDFPDQRHEQPEEQAPGQPTRLASLPDDYLDGMHPAEAEKEDMRQADARRWEESRDRQDAREYGRRRGREQLSEADCERPSGTTGAILGAVAGGLLGNVIDGGRHRAAGTIVGAGGGALLGREIERNGGRCR